MCKRDRQKDRRSMTPHLQTEIPRLWGCIRCSNYRFRNVSQSHVFTVSTSLMEPIAYISWTNIEGDLMARSLYTLAMDFCKSSASYKVDTCQLYSYIHRNRQSLWSDFSFDTFVPFWLLSRPPARTEFYDSTFWLIGYHGAGTAVA